MKKVHVSQYGCLTALPLFWCCAVYVITEVDHRNLVAPGVFEVFLLLLLLLQLLLPRRPAFRVTNPGHVFVFDRVVRLGEKGWKRGKRGEWWVLLGLWGVRQAGGNQK